MAKSKTKVDSLMVIASNGAPIKTNVFMTLFQAWQRRENSRIYCTDKKDNGTKCIHDRVWIYGWQKNQFIRSIGQVPGEGRVAHPEDDTQKEQDILAPQ